MEDTPRESEKRIDTVLGDGENWGGVIITYLIIILIVTWTP
jgi:hypothetical protein